MVKGVGVAVVVVFDIGVEVPFGWFIFRFGSGFWGEGCFSFEFVVCGDSIFFE